MDNGVFAEAPDCRKRAEAIFSRLGGKDNIISAAHCATRLCRVIEDNRKIDTKALEEKERVKDSSILTASSNAWRSC